MIRRRHSARSMRMATRAAGLLLRVDLEAGAAARCASDRTHSQAKGRL